MTNDIRELMMQSVESALGGAASVSAERLHKIRVLGDSRVVSCEETRRVTDAVEAFMLKPNCRPVKVGCRNGGCGVCRVRVLSGEYVTRKMSRDHVSAEDEARGYVLACRLYPKSDLEIEPAFVDRRESGKSQ